MPRRCIAGNYGLMQIRLGTARGVGYSGDAKGLLDPDTNLTYAVKYLAGAYRAAGCDADRAVAYYQRGYYGAAQRECGAPSPRNARCGCGRRDQAQAWSHRSRSRRRSRACCRRGRAGDVSSRRVVRTAADRSRSRRRTAAAGETGDRAGARCAAS